MKIFILGAGRRGIRLAKHLIEENKDVVILDQNPNDVSKAMENADCLGFTANGLDTENLSNSGIEEADAFIALTGSDETNLVSCGIVAAEYNVPITIATVKSLSYTERGKQVNLMGINHIVNPSQEVANHIYNNISRGLYSDTINFKNARLVLYNVYVDGKSKFRNKTVKTLKRLIPGHYIIATINRNNDVFVPNGDTVILQNDTLSICINEDTEEELLTIIGKTREKPRKTIIIGATLVTDFLLKNLKKRERKHTTVISRDCAACEELAVKYPDLLIINENITKEGVFEQQNIDDYDLLICATDSDELNVIISSYAKKCGVKTTIALINKTQSFIQMAEHLNIDSLLSSQDLIVDSILKFIQGRNISSVHSLFDGKIETFEYTVTENCPVVGKMLKQINMKNKGLIIGAYKKNGEAVLPGGSYVIESNDTIVIIFERQSIDFIKNLFGLEDLTNNTSKDKQKLVKTDDNTVES